MRWLRALGVSDFGIFPELGTALCALAAAELAPLYKAMYPQGYRGPAGAFPKVRCARSALSCLYCGRSADAHAGAAALLPCSHLACTVVKQR